MATRRSWPHDCLCNTIVIGSPAQSGPTPCPCGRKEAGRCGRVGWVTLDRMCVCQCQCQCQSTSASSATGLVLWLDGSHHQPSTTCLCTHHVFPGIPADTPQQGPCPGNTQAWMRLL